METSDRPRKNLVEKIGNAYRGMFQAYRAEISLRIQTGCAVGVMVAGLILQVSRTDWMWLVAATACVLITEILNTAIERLVDLVSPQFHPQAGLVKDLAAGAVFMTVLFSLVIGSLVFYPYVMN